MVPVPAMATVLPPGGAGPLVAAGRPPRGVWLGVLAVLVRRQLAGPGAVVATLGPVAGVVLVVHLAAPHGRSNPPGSQARTSRVMASVASVTIASASRPPAA